RAPAPEPLPAPAAQAPAAARAQDHRPRAEEHAEPSEAEEPLAGAPKAHAAEEPAECAPETTTPPPPAKSPAEVHDWLTRRIDALQTERQGRWQKLLQI